MSGVRPPAARALFLPQVVSILTPPMSGVRRLEVIEFLPDKRFQSSPHP